MIVPIIFSPSWDLNPAYNLALLSAVLKKEGFKPVCLDYNLDFYNRVKDPSEKRTWSGGDEGFCWRTREFTLKIMKKYNKVIREYVNQILALNSKVVCFSVNVRNLFFVYELAKKIKRKSPGKIIILGGPECFRIKMGIRVLSERAIDTVCLGEGEVDFINMLNIIKKNGKPGFCPGFGYRKTNSKFSDCGEGNIAENLNQLPFADFSWYNLSEFKKINKEIILPIMGSKGCVNRCSFCETHKKMNFFRSRNAENIFEEIKFQKRRYPEIDGFYFTDAAVNADIRMLNKLAELLIESELKVKWSSQAFIRKSMSLEFLKKLKKSGLECLVYGVESGSDKVLKLMKKGYNSELAEKVLRDTVKAGIECSFNIIVGHPGEEEADFRKTIDFVNRNIDYTNSVNLNLLNLVENTDLYDNADKWGISFKPDLEFEWRSLDGKNILAERVRRLKVLKEVVSEKAVYDTDFDVEADLEQGDKYARGGKLKEALKLYRAAKRKNRCRFMEEVINQKISDVKI